MRFRPPTAPIDVEVAWLLARAFGPRDVGSVARVDGETAYDRATRLDLVARVAARTPHELLSAVCGPTIAERFRHALHRTAAEELRAQWLCRRLASLAKHRPVVFLKGAGMLLGGHSTSGTRTMVDVDALVSANDAQGLQRELVELGWQVHDVPPCEHQLAPISREGEGTIELHVMVPGLRLGGRSATVEDLIQGGHTLEAGSGLVVPEPAILRAHAIVHGVAQHGLTPAAYPMCRMLADLADLDGGDAELIAAWLTEDVSEPEVAATLTLARRLRAGDDPRALSAASSDEAILLRHVVHGALDADYAASLRLASLLTMPTDGSRLTQLWHALGDTLWLSHEQIDTIYGRPVSALGYAFRRVVRPVDLLMRAGRHTAAWLRHRRR
jgi:Uncharacterised nucleotidyltransferase